MNTTNNHGETVDTDSPEPFTQADVFRFIDFIRSIALVALAASIVLVGVPFVAGLVRGYGIF